MPDTALIRELGGTDEGARAVAALVADPARGLVAVDFDGTLSPIVDDPEQAYALPAAVDALARLGRVTRLAVVTGRPARVAVRLGGFEGREGLERLRVLGQYGVERWDAATGELHEPPAPEAILELGRRLPAVLAEAGHPDLYVEDKGRALAVHTRRAPDPAAAFAAVEGPLRALADELDLHVEPGRNVVEIRAAGQDKGLALGELLDELEVDAVAYAGDDLGDLAAYDAVTERRAADGPAGVLLFAESAEQEALRERSDVTVEGPPGVARWLEGLASLLGV